MSGHGFPDFLAGEITAFVRENTVHVEGLGDVCSLTTFDLARHGNPRYGSPLACPKVSTFVVLLLEHLPAFPAIAI